MYNFTYRVNLILDSEQSNLIIMFTMTAVFISVCHKHLG